MKRTPEENKIIATWWLLQELKYHFISNSDGETADFKLKEPTEADEPELNIKIATLNRLSDFDASISLVDWGNNSYSVIKGQYFDKTYDNYKTKIKKLDTDTDEPITFDDDEAILKLGRKKCQLPPFGKEHLLCQVMFEYKPNQSVDTGEILEKMQETVDERAKRMVKDTVRRVNDRANKVLGLPKLFEQSKGTIKRLK